MRETTDQTWRKKSQRRIGADPRNRETGYWSYEDADFDEIEVGDWIYGVHAFEPEMFRVARIRVKESGKRIAFADRDKVPDYSRVPSVIEGHMPVRKRIWNRVHGGICDHECEICENEGVSA